MTLIDKQLVQALNSGRCFALVGAGPSAELGVPTWGHLAAKVFEHFAPELPKRVLDRSRNLVAYHEYPELFTALETAVTRPRLLTCVRDNLHATRPQGPVYDMLARWPFACYLTTNYDDYLTRALNTAGLPFVTRRNGLDDFVSLRAGATGIVFKIHGDFTTPDSLVLTSADYDTFRKQPDRGYWREKIAATLHMVDLVILGYSATDPDFREQLERAQQVAAPDHPVFMFASGFGSGRIQEFYQQYNIRIISYDNVDGTHRELHRLLRRYDPFVAKRGSATIGLPQVDDEQASLASSLYLFRQLRVDDIGASAIERAYATLILRSLSGHTGRLMAVNELREEVRAKTYAISDIDPVALDQSITRLYNLGYISVDLGANQISIESAGLDIVARVRGERQLLSEKFKASCRIFLRAQHPELEDARASAVIEAIDLGLVKAFERRGLELARAAFSGYEMDMTDQTDVLEIINAAGGTLTVLSEQAAFADLMIEVFLTPTGEMREHLAALSQGYFAYHTMGFDPGASKERLSLAQHRVYIIDSSIVLPLLAVDSSNHAYAADLLRRMVELSLQPRTTERLFDEVVEHAQWAVRNVGSIAATSPNMLQAAMAGPGYKQNLFVDGFVRWSVRAGNPSFPDYLTICLGSDWKSDLRGSIRRRVVENGVGILEFSEVVGFTENDWVLRDEIADKIEWLRKAVNAFRGADQCQAEAEVALICERMDGVFLSQSGILNRLGGVVNRPAWRPEAMYRFLAMFGEAPADADLLYRCMTQDFYYAGFDIVDLEAVARFAAPMVRQARMNLEQEREAYEKALGEARFAELRDEFESVPDEQKPFYSMQLAFHVAHLETQKREGMQQRLAAAEAARPLNEAERERLVRLETREKERRERAEAARRQKRSKRSGGRQRRMR